MQHGGTKGRGAQSGDLSDRFGLPQRHADPTPPERAPRTTVTEESPRSIVTFNQSPDIPFDRSINAYRGCEHGCIYCYARPTHAYLDLSPGLDFETQLFAKPNAAQLLRETFARPKYRPAPIALGTNTDPYQPIEDRYRITRQILEVCLEARHPVTITTKSDRVLRDLDLLVPLAEQNLTAVALSVTSLDRHLSRLLEPRAATPDKRLEAIATLARHKVPVHCSVAPVIPALTDEFIERIVEAAAGAGARSINWIPLRLPHEVAPLFREWLETHYPDRAGKVMAIVQAMRKGRDNDPNFFSRMKASGVWGELLRARFALACRRSGIQNTRLELDCSAFRPGRASQQLDLF